MLDKQVKKAEKYEKDSNILKELGFVDINEPKSFCDGNHELKF